jgi:uncharacterized protein (DUF362 family)
MGIDKKRDDKIKDNTTQNKISRRGFISAVGVVTAGTMLSSCKKKSTGPEPPKVNPNKTGDVALAKLSNYSYDTLKSKLETLFTQVGGLEDVISSGDKVAIKINLTGGNSQVWSMNQYNCTVEESIWTHSSVLRAVGELLLDAGASKITIVEGQGSEIINNVSLGYLAVKMGLGADYINLNNAAPYSGFTDLPVSGGFNFDKFTVNPILAEVDKYVTIPKMKCHYTAGITLSMKNNVGMVPDTAYGSTGYRNHLHGTGGDLSEAGWHLPQTIVDLNLARPVDLAIIDGIITMDKGEGPWVDNVIAPVNAKALIVSKDALKADAIGMQVMGFDPLAGHYADPFVSSENWLLKAQQKGLGDPNPENIVVAGNFASDFTYQFHPCDENPASMADTGVHRMAPYCGKHFYSQEHLV